MWGVYFVYDNVCLAVLWVYIFFILHGGGCTLRAHMSMGYRMNMYRGVILIL